MLINFCLAKFEPPCLSLHRPAAIRRPTFVKKIKNKPRQNIISFQHQICASSQTSMVLLVVYLYGTIFCRAHWYYRIPIQFCNTVIAGNDTPRYSKFIIIKEGHERGSIRAPKAPVKGSVHVHQSWCCIQVKSISTSIMLFCHNSGGSTISPVLISIAVEAQPIWEW